MILSRFGYEYISSVLFYVGRLTCDRYVRIDELIPQRGYSNNNTSHLNCSSNGTFLRATRYRSRSMIYHASQVQARNATVSHPGHE